MSRDPDRLYKLLPELHRIADSEQGQQLQALLALVTRQADALRIDTQQLWDDFFIETCQRWVIPYIGQLVGNVALHDLDLTAASATAESIFDDLARPDLTPPGAIRLRADVAKTIYYRRRKGTPAMLEELAADVTGWGARVVEFLERLDWNQHLEHLRLEAHGCPDLRRVDVGSRVGGPWDTTSHAVDVRRIGRSEGWYNIPNIGFFLWRLSAFPLTTVQPRAIGSGPEWRFTFSPLGMDTPLFCSGERSRGASPMAAEPDIPGPIRPAAFFVDPPFPGAALPAPNAAYYGDIDAGASMRVFADGNDDAAALPLDEVRCANLETWATLTQPTGTKILMDVSRGRLIVPAGRAGQKITVSYYYGFSAPMGGGEYDRRKWIVASPAPPSTDVVGGGGALAARIAARPPSATHNVINIADDATYVLTSDITLNLGESLTIQASNGFRPHVRLHGGSIAILTAGGTSSLTLGGLLVEGGLRIDGDLDALRLIHTTLVPDRSLAQEAPGQPSGPSVVVASGPAGTPINTQLEIKIAFSVVGALRMPAHVKRLWLLDSIVDGSVKAAGGPVAAVCDAAGSSGPPAHVERSTLFGASWFLQLDLASESIFCGTVTVDRQQGGCMRFCYVTRGSKTPQQYRCQPALQAAIETERRRTEAAASGTTLPSGWETVLADEVAGWLVPTFESDHYGRPDYGQLRLTCPAQIRTGAEDGSEVGAFCLLKQPQRESNLRIRLDEYLPVGLEAGLIYVT